MIKLLSLVSLLFVLCLIFPTQTSAAALLTITEEGSASWNVLSSTSSLTPSITPSQSLEIKHLAQNTSFSSSSLVSLKNNQGKIELKVNSNGFEKTADVTGFEDDIIEVERALPSQNIKISVDGNYFLLSEQSFTAETTYPLLISPQNHEISVETPSGIKYLSIMPAQAVENVIQANLVNYLPQLIIPLSENNSGELQYQVQGSRIIELFNIFEYSVPVSASVSASTGQILEIEQPLWFSLFGFLLT